jgi:MFS superfamily sulfate permease-like transporter
MAEPQSTELAHPSRGGWWSDLLSSLVVFMVALPLCIGIAQASGLPPEAGIVSGIVGGLLVGIISGSPLQVAGPAAGLIVLVLQFLDDAQNAGYQGTRAVHLLGVAILLAGAIQILAGALRLGQWFRAVSPAVVGGMLAGIGITIIAKQFHVMVDDAPPKKVIDGLITIPEAIWKGFSPPPEAAANHSAAALVGVVTILILVFWKSIVPKSLKVIPAAIVAVGVAVGFAELGGLGIDRVALSGSLADAFRPIAWPGWDVLGMGLVWKAALTFAVIASAETLLCAVAVDTMHNGPRAKFDRELAAQGVGNVICGALAALPMTGVIVRSSANVEAGARTRLSTILHGLWLLLFVAALPGILSRIPLAALAAILVYTGWKLVNIPGLVRLWKEGRSEAGIYVATALTIMVADLLTGVVAGVALAAIRLLWSVAHVTVTRHDEPGHRRVHVYIEGAATFLRLPVIADALEGLPQGQKVHVHLDRLQFVDHAILQLLITFQRQYEAGGGTLYIDWDRLHAHFKGPRTSARKADESVVGSAGKKSEMRDSQADFACNSDVSHSCMNEKAQEVSTGGDMATP